MKKCIQVLFLVVLLSLSTVSATRELSTNGVCYIEQCGCPEAFLATWCGDASQLADSWCQKNDSNCGNCAGVWCEGQDNNTDNQADNNENQEENQENQENQEDGQGICYISQCGCPGEFKLDYCRENIHKLPAGYCQESKNNCVNNCDGAWCNQSSKRVLSSQNGRCFIGQCGCPGNYYLDWCSEENQLTSSYCTESSENCELCDGVWCEDEQQQEDNQQEQNDQDQDSNEDVDLGNGVCFIEQCGCPGDFKLDYCTNQNVLPEGFCQESSENCSQCAGVWCGGDNQEEQEEEESDAADEYICFISQCGCPGSYLLDYCNETNVLPEGYCQYSENNCVQNCDGAWCKV